MRDDMLLNDIMNKALTTHERVQNKINATETSDFDGAGLLGYVTMWTCR
jgi:hypothetical protein